MWKHWADYRTFWPIFITLVLLPIYFVYSLVSIYRTFTTFIGQCPAWLAVSTPLLITINKMHNFYYRQVVIIFIAKLIIIIISLKSRFFWLMYMSTYLTVFIQKRVYWLSSCSPFKILAGVSFHELRCPCNNLLFYFTSSKSLSLSHTHTHPPS